MTAGRRGRAPASYAGRRLKSDRVVKKRQDPDGRCLPLLGPDPARFLGKRWIRGSHEIPTGAACNQPIKVGTTSKKPESRTVFAACGHRGMGTAFFAL